MVMTNTRRTVVFPPEGSTSSPDVTFASSTKMAIFAPTNKPYRIIRWGVVVTVAPVDTGTATLQFQGNVSPVPLGTGTLIATGATTSNSGTGYNSSNAPTFYVDTGGGTLTVPNSQLKSPATVPIGTVLWHTVNPQAAQTGGYYPAPDTALISPGGVDTQLVIYPGQSFVINCVAVPSTAGHGQFFIDTEEQAFTADYNNNAMVLSGYPSSNGTTPTPSWPFYVGSLNYQS